MHLSVPAGRQAGRQAGLELLYCVLRLRSSSWVHWSQSFSGQEPRKRQSGRGEEWRASCLTCGLSALGKKVKLQLLTLLTLERSGRIQTSAQTSVSQLRRLLPQLLIWGEATCHGVVWLNKSLCVVGNVGNVYQLKISCFFKTVLRSLSPSQAAGLSVLCLPGRLCKTLPLMSLYRPPLASLPFPSSFTTFFLLLPPLH